MEPEFEVDELSRRIKFWGTIMQLSNIEPLDPLPMAFRTRRIGVFDYVGEALHRDGVWIRLTPHVWSRWAAERWLRYFGLEMK